MSNPDTPVPASAAPDQLASALRALLIALGGYVAGKGWLDASIITAAIPVIMIVGPTIWAQLKARSMHNKLVVATKP